MWLFSESGFLSTVMHYENPRILVVRARDHLSLEGISEFADVPIVSTPENDYPFRVTVGKDLFAEWLMDQLGNLNYTNYKAHMWSARPEFADALHEVWATMHAVEPSRDSDAARERLTVQPPTHDWAEEDIESLKGLGHI